MPLERLERLQIIPTTLADAWTFFARPDNLATITPPWLSFKVTSALQDEMYPGMIITYTVNPFLGLPVDWVTEITHCREPDFFVDEQRIGPYRLWHHEHHFREVAGGVEARDLIHYQLPFGPLGALAAPFVRHRLKSIFDYRTEKVTTLFQLSPFAHPPHDINVR